MQHLGCSTRIVRTQGSLVIIHHSPSCRCGKGFWALISKRKMSLYESSSRQGRFHSGFNGKYVFIDDMEGAMDNIRLNKGLSMSCTTVQF